MFSYMIYASVLLLASIPVLYFSIQKIIAEDVDEQLILQKNKLINKLANEPSFSNFVQKLQPHVLIEKAGGNILIKDSFYTVEIYDSVVKEVEPYRMLKSYFHFQENNYRIQISDSLVDAVDLKESIVKIVGIILLLMVTGLIIINRFISSNLWKPFHETIKKLKNHSIENDTTLDLKKTSITEFAALNDTLTAMAGRNQKIFQSQKQFTENASHEMQTPLAVLQAKIDLLMQTNPVTPQQAAIIMDIENVNQRMNRLNKNLLLLTKIDNDQFGEKEDIHLAAMLEKSVEQYEFTALQKNIIVEINVEQNKKITANKTFIEIMIGNLLSNAIKYNIYKGKINISLTSHAIIFCNTGKNKPLNATTIFERFYKETSDSNSIGLGLQIAKKIATGNGLNIKYEFIDDLHCFTISFLPT